MWELAQSLDREWVNNPTNRNEISRRLDQVVSEIGLAQTPQTGRLGITSRDDSTTTSRQNEFGSTSTTTTATTPHRTTKLASINLWPASPRGSLNRARSKSSGDISERDFEMKELKSFFQALEATAASGTETTKSLSTSEESSSSEEKDKLATASALDRHARRQGVLSGSGLFLFDDFLGFSSYPALRAALDAKFKRMQIPITTHSDWNEMEMVAARPTTPTAKAEKDTRGKSDSWVLPKTEDLTSGPEASEESLLRDSTAQSVTLGSADTSETPSTGAVPKKTSSKIMKKKKEDFQLPMLEESVLEEEIKIPQVDAPTGDQVQVATKKDTLYENWGLDQVDGKGRSLGSSDRSLSFRSATSSQPYASSTPKTDDSVLSRPSPTSPWATRRGSVSFASPIAFNMSNDEAFGMSLIFMYKTFHLKFLHLFLIYSMA